MNKTHTGGCHCGQLRYQFSGPLHDIAHCHCSICRRVSGGIVTTWITVPTSAFQWLAGTPSRYDSSSTCMRYFCGHCGAQLALVTHLSPESIDLTIATLDHPEQAPAERHIWTDSRLPWLHLTNTCPARLKKHSDQKIDRSSGRIAPIQIACSVWSSRSSPVSGCRNTTRPLRFSASHGSTSPRTCGSKAN